MVVPAPWVAFLWEGMKSLGLFHLEASWSLQNPEEEECGRAQGVVVSESAQEIFSPAISLSSLLWSHRGAKSSPISSPCVFLGKCKKERERAVACECL